MRTEVLYEMYSNKFYFTKCRPREIFKYPSTESQGETVAGGGETV